MATTWKKVITADDDSTHLNSEVTLSDFSSPGSPASGTNFLNETGAWAVPAGTADTNTTYSTSIPISTTKLRLTAGGDGSGTDDIEFLGGTNATVTRTSASVFTIASSNTQLDNAGVIGKVLTGLTSGSGTVVATDTIVAGISRLEGRVATNDDKVTDANHNVTTNLTITGDTGARVIVSSDGTDATIPIATTSVSGLLSPGLFDEIDANTAKATDVNHNVTTNLTITGTTGARTIVSSDGTNAEIPVASALASGVMSQASFQKLGNMEANATADQSATDIGTLFANDTTLVNFGGAVTVTGNLTVSGTTTTLNTATVETEDHVIRVATNASPTTTTGNAGGIEVQTSTTDAQNARLVWLTAGNLSGWHIKDSGTGSESAVCTMAFHATTAPTTEGAHGIGSFYFEADGGTGSNGALYVRTL